MPGEIGVAVAVEVGAGRGASHVELATESIRALLEDERDPFEFIKWKEILDLMEQEHTTLLFGVPTMMQMLADAPGFGACDLSSLLYAIVGGAPMPVPLINLWHERGVFIRQGYGLTEVGPNCFVLHERDAIRKAGSVGSPVLHLDTRLVDAAGQQVAVGVDHFVEDAEGVGLVDDRRVGLDPAQQVRAGDRAQPLRGLGFAVAFDGHGVPGPEPLGGAEDAGVEDVHDRPQVRDAVLHRCTGQHQAPRSVCCGS